MTAAPIERGWWKDSSTGLMVSGENADETCEWQWIDVEAPNQESLRSLARRFELDAIAVEDALDSNLFPKYEDFGHFIAVAIHGVSTKDDRVSTAPLLCFVGKTFLVTLHTEPMPGLEFVVTTAMTHQPTAEGGPGRMFARLADAGSRRFEPLLVQIDSLLLECESRALAGEPGSVRMLQPVRRQVNTLRPVMRAQRSVLQSIVYSETDLLGARALRRLTDVHERHARIEDDLELARLTANSIVELHRGTVAESANEVMKVLTVFSATLMPMTLVAGIYGMNFKNIPELDYRFGYPIALLTMVTIGSLMWRYFSRRGFVGRPRIGDHIAPVTSLLVQAAKAPVHAMGSLVTGALGGHDDVK